MAEQTVELSPSESKQVSFEAIPHEAKTYQVSVNRLSGSFKALPSIEITGFHYVYKGAYTWGLTGKMLHGYDITHIGFTFRNNRATNVPGVSLKCRVTDGGKTYWPTPPRDQYQAQIPQPMTIAPGATKVWYKWAPAWHSYPWDATITAEVYVNGELVATRSLDFTISYD